MARINKEYEHGYGQGYEYYGYAGGLIIDAQQEVIRRFGKRTLYSSYGKGFLQGFKDHREGKECKYNQCFLFHNLGELVASSNIINPYRGF